MKNQKSLSLRFIRTFPKFSWAAFPITLGFWGVSEFVRLKGASPLTLSIFLKGGCLLVLAWALYTTVFRKSKTWTVFLPLGWLASSGSLWEVCHIPEIRFWIWLILFLSMVLVILWVPDPRILSALLFLPWGALSWLFKFSFLVPLAFTSSFKVGKKVHTWVLWAAPAMALAWFFILQGYYYAGWNGADIWDFWFGQKMGIFLLIAMVGTMGSEETFFGNFRPALLSFLFLVLGSLVWGGHGLIGLWQSDLFVWLAILFSGLGWDALRRELLGEEWFHKTLGYSIGIALWCSSL